MIALCIRLISKGILLIAKIIVLGLPLFLFPILMIYTSYLRAETHIPDPLAGHIIIKMPELITVPVLKKSIRKGSVIRETDLTYEDFPQEAINETIAQDSMQLVGQEAQKSLYRNKPIFLRDLGSRTIIKRNDMVTMLFTKGAMILQTTGRAMENGGTGDTIKVMNDHSKKIVTGKITAEGDVNVAL